MPKLTYITFLLVLISNNLFAQDVLNNCSDINIPSDKLSVTLEANADGVGIYEIAIPKGDIINYELFDNNEKYEGKVGGCRKKKVFAYNCDEVKKSFFLNNWTVNGQTFSGKFNNLEELVSAMNAWDPAGQWYCNAYTGNIIGGDLGNRYTNFDLVQAGNLSSISTIINVRSATIPTAVQMTFKTGNHLLEVKDIVTGCSARVKINVLPAGVSNTTQMSAK